MNGDQIVVDKETPDMLNTLGMNEIPGIVQVDPVPVQKSFRFGRSGFGGAGRSPLIGRSVAKNKWVWLQFVTWNQQSGSSWPKLEAKGKTSFAEKLKGKNKGSFSSDEDNGKDTGVMSDSKMSKDEKDCEQGDPPCQVEEDLHRNFSSFTFSERIKKRLYKAWRKVFIVKLLGRSIGYKALLSRLQSLWVK
ncbi:hypothetical protein K1719_006536 [Acacia pycnantha]|nr:hypothetical protein K1719_006536 [Acacia pycnantha]